MLTASVGSEQLPTKPDLSLWVEVTEHCNLRCSFCYNDWRSSDPNSWTQIDIDYLEESIARITELATVKQVAISGGEPALYRDLTRLVRFLQVNDIAAILTTNGAGLTGRRLVELRNAGLTSVQVAVLSTRPELHNRLAGGRNAWKTAISCLAHCREALIPTAVIFVATQQNLGELPSVFELCKVLGARSLIVNRFVPAGLGAENLNSLKIDDADLLELVQSVSRRDTTPQIILGVPLDLPSAETGIALKVDCAPQLTIGVDGQIRGCSQSLQRSGTITDAENLSALLSAGTENSEDCYCASIASHNLIRGQRKLSAPNMAARTQN